MSRKRESAPEYKETVAFELFPTLEYDKAQKQRLIPFHALKNNIRRIINYAAHFDAPNRICMVYIVGEVAPEKIQSLLTAAECSDRVCVLTSAFPDDEIKFWREFDKLRDTLTKRGHWDDENRMVNAFWLDAYNATRSFKEFYEAERPDMDGQIGLAEFDFQYDEGRLASVEADLQRQAETLETIRRYHALARKAPSYFRRWTLHRRGREPTTFRHANTGKLIAKIYPYGAEARGVNAYAGLSPASAEAAVKLIMDGVENRRLGFGRDELIRSAAARKIRKFVRDAIAANGYCSLFDLKDFVESPPFGLGNNGYSSAMLSAALFEEDGLIYRDSVSDSDVKRNMYALFLLLLSEGTSRHSVMATVLKRMKMDRRWYLPCLYKEYPCHKTVRKALAELYGVPDEWVGLGIVNRCRSRIEELFRLPLSVSDDLLFYLTGPEICWYDRAEMERLAAEVTARREELPRILAAHIAKDKRIPTREWIPGAACWLWDKETSLDAPLCMMSPEEKAQYDANRERANQCNRKANALKWDRSDGAAERYKEAEAEEARAYREEREYIQNLSEPCKRRLLALCGNPNL